MPAGSTAWTLIFGWCFTYLIRFAHDKGCGVLGTVGLVAGLSTFFMMALLTALCFVAGDRMGMPGSCTLGATVALLVAGCGREVGALCLQTSTKERKNSFSMVTLVRAFITLYFAVLTITMVVGRPETQISTGAHQPFTADGTACLAEDVDLVEYRRLRFVCRDPPRHLPGSGNETDTPWHARGWAHDTKFLPPIHRPSEYLDFDCDTAEVRSVLSRAGLSAVLPESVPTTHMGVELASWYTVCGVKSSNTLGLYWCVGLGLVGAALYNCALQQGRGDLNASDRTSPGNAMSSSKSLETTTRITEGAGVTTVDQEIENTNKRQLTIFGKVLKHSLDAVVEPILEVSGGWVVASVALGVLMVVLQFLAGAAFQKALGHMIGPAALPTSRPILQPVYDVARRVVASLVPAWLPCGAAHPIVPSILAIGSYLAVALGFIAVDFFLSGLGFVQAYQCQAPNGKVARTWVERFGGESLGLWRVVKSHILFNGLLIPVYMSQLTTHAPHLYPPPWFLVAGRDPGAGQGTGVSLPLLAPSLFEFVLTFLFSTITMDAGYGWWHFLAHRYRQIYKNVHAWHHEYHAPFALVSQHAHPIELSVTGALAVCGPIACGAHPFSLWVCLVISVLMSVDAHCGYDLPWFVNLRKLSFGLVGGAKHHDDHHRKPWGNFAPFFTYLDVLAGTDHAA